MSKGRFSRVVVGGLDFRETNRFLCLGAKICDLDFFLSLKIERVAGCCNCDL